MWLRTLTTRIPKRMINGESCFCGLHRSAQQEKCFYCSHQYRKQIEDSVKLGKLLVDKQLVAKPGGHMAVTTGQQTPSSF